MIKLTMFITFTGTVSIMENVGSMRVLQISLGCSIVEYNTSLI